MYSTIASSSDGPLVTIALARPQKKNPIGPLTLGELVHALEAVKADPALRVVIVTGQGDTFSAGADLGQLAGGAQPGAIASKTFPELFAAMHALGHPIIAMVNGAALAGGFGLVCACDLAVAADSSVMGTTEVNVGLWPMMIGAEIIRVLGKKRTLELMLTGKKISAAQALEWGLVNQVVPAGELEARTRELALSLAGRSPTALGHGLAAYYETQDLEYRAGLAELEKRLFALLGTEDAAEGLAAFLQKRPPVWKGR